MNDALDDRSAPKRRRREESTRQDYRCIFEHQGRRCRMPRVYCESPLGIRGYCHHHRPEEHRDHGREQDVFFSSVQRNQQCMDEWLKAQYAEKLPDYVHRKALEMHPEWARQPSETAIAHGRRMREEALTMRAGVMRKMRETTDAPT